MHSFSIISLFFNECGIFTFLELGIIEASKLFFLDVTVHSILDDDVLLLRGVSHESLVIRHVVVIDEAEKVKD